VRKPSGRARGAAKGPPTHVANEPLKAARCPHRRPPRRTIKREVDLQPGHLATQTVRRIGAGGHELRPNPCLDLNPTPTPTPNPRTAHMFEQGRTFDGVRFVVVVSAQRGG
jgi:hypothetical protein